MKNHQLHIVTGQPAVGKTTWGRHLAKKINGAFLDIDIVSEPIVQAALSLAGLAPSDRDSPQFKRALREPIYQSLFATAQANLPHMNVVITGPFTKELAHPTWHNDLVSQFDCQVFIYWLSADEFTIKQRMKMRNADRDQAKLANWQAYQAYYKDVSSPRCRHEKVEI